MAAPIKQIAEMEREVSQFLFKDSHEFIKKIITVMLDEPTTRDLLSKFLMKVNS